MPYDMEFLARPGRGEPFEDPVNLAAGTGVTDAAIDISVSETGYYKVVDEIVVTYGSAATANDFTLDFVGWNETFDVDFDETGAAGMKYISDWFDFVNQAALTNTVNGKVFYGTKKPFIMAPSGDSISIDGRNASAAANYADATNSIPLSITVKGRKIAIASFQ